MATSPSVTPAPTERSGPGCVTVAILLPVVVISGFIIGAVMSDEEDPNGEKSVTLDAGEIDGVDWVVNAERDAEGDTCAFLYQDDEQLTGACTLTPQDATIGDQTVLFGRAASDATSVRVRLDNAEVVEIDTTTAEGLDGRFYVKVVDGDVDADGFAT